MKPISTPPIHHHGMVLNSAMQTEGCVHVCILKIFSFHYFLCLPFLLFCFHLLFILVPFPFVFSFLYLFCILLPLLPPPSSPYYTSSFRTFSFLHILRSLFPLLFFLLCPLLFTSPFLTAPSPPLLCFLFRPHNCTVRACKGLAR
jgi:hypothetical protein